MAMDFCSGVAVMNVCFFVGALCKRTWRWKRLNCYVAACAVMVVWFFVGALCKRPWRWKRLNCYVAACAAFFVAVPRFFAGHSPCAPDAGNLFPHPSFRTVEHVFPYSIFCLRATRIWYILYRYACTVPSVQPYQNISFRRVLRCGCLGWFSTFYMV